MLKPVGATLTALLLAACAPTTLSGGPSAGHLRTETAPATTGTIPQPVQAMAALPRPKGAAKTETYSVVVNNVKVQDLLFALARDLSAALQASQIQALGAAAREDAGSVFAVAARIDELGKPALGNRAIARKLNTEGLEALKADDPARAAELFRKGLAENPRDVEIAGNLGFALVKAGKAEEAVGVLTAALALDPRRSSTWTPLAEALALAGRKDESQAALWVAYQWSGNREKSLAFYSDRAEKERASRPAISELYASVLGWVTDGRRPRLASLMAG